MCLLLLAWRAHPDYTLILAGNRDERHARASAPAGFWPDAPEVLAGRDMEAGGTWLGVTAAGRFAVVTNYREGLKPVQAPRSRGALTAEFLKSEVSAAEYLRAVAQAAHDYGAFSLICGDRDSLWYLSNRGEAAPREVAPGLHGLSNHLLDTPWPKVESGKARLKLLLEQDAPLGEPLFRLLADRIPADHGLPDTGIGAELERRVSAAFVADPVYGTRCSTLLHLQQDGGIRFSERRFGPSGEPQETRHFHLTDMRA